jgi:hypothetical protein
MVSPQLGIVLQTNLIWIKLWLLLWISSRESAFCCESALLNPVFAVDQRS